jgi:hypothetical protein
VVVEVVSMAALVSCFVLFFLLGDSEMTTETVADQRFAWIAEHGGPVVSWDGRYCVVGDGLVGWFAHDFGADSPVVLNKHIDETNGTRMLALGLFVRAAPSTDPVYWNSTLKVGEGRYVRVRGSSPDFLAALSQAETYVHESRQMGGLTWWCESETQWVSWLGSFDLSARKIDGRDRDPYWHFEVKGEAPTLEEATLLAALGRAAEAGGQP